MSLCLYLVLYERSNANTPNLASICTLIQGICNRLTCDLSPAAAAVCDTAVGSSLGSNSLAGMYGAGARISELAVAREALVQVEAERNELRAR